MAWIDGDYSLRLAAPLSEEQAEALRAIPGVRIRAGKVLAPVNAGWLLHREARERGIGGAFAAPVVPRPSVLPPSPGAAVDWFLPRLGGTEIRPGSVEIALDFQLAGAGRCAWTESGYLVHPPGAGKTFSALMWAASEPGPILVGTPAAVRDSWWREVARWTDFDAHVVDPDVYRRVSSEKLPGYLDRCARQGIRPVVIVGWEGLRGWLDALRAHPWRSLVLDEAHYCKNHRRRKMIPGADGQSWSARSLDNLSWAAEHVSRAATRRLAASATPIPDRMRDAWSPCDLVEPGSWGSYSAFAHRYCAARPGRYGGLDDGGRSREEEFAARWSFTADRVPYEVTHARLPPKRRIVTRLPRDRQDTPSAAAAAEIRAALRMGPHHLHRARLLEAASRCRSYVLSVVADILGAGGKVVAYAGLQSDCERLARDVARVARAAEESRLARGLCAEEAGVGAWWFHGESASPGARHAMREAYMAHPGPAVLVGTTEVLMVGQDLHDTDRAVVAHVPWNHGDVWQLENRVSRLGQRRPCTVEYVVPVGTVAEHIVEIVLDKAEVLDTIVPDPALAGLRTDLEGLGDPEAVLAALVARMEAADRARDEDDEDAA